MTDPDRIERGAVVWVRWPAYAKQTAHGADLGFVDCGTQNLLEIRRENFIALADALEAEGRRQEREAQAATFWADAITKDEDHAP